MNTTIQYRGLDINSNKVVYGYFVRIGFKFCIVEFHSDNMTQEIHHVMPSSVTPILGKDENGNFICKGDIVDVDSISGEPLSAELAVVLVDKYGKHYYAPKDYKWFVGSDTEYKPTVTRGNNHDD